MSYTAYPRILISAYQCRPGIEAVSQIGWQWYSRLSSRLPVILITHVRNREFLLAAGAPLHDSEIIFIDTEWFAKPLYRLALKLFPYSEHATFLLSSLDFYIYDWQAVRQAKLRLKQGENWDIIHAVTPVSPTAATRLHTLKRPLVLGPWNGGLQTLATFPEIMKQDASWVYSIRNLGGMVNFLFGTTRNAAAILTATQATLARIPQQHHQRCHMILENGVDLQLFKPIPWPSPPSSTQPLKIIYVGRFLPFKGLPMLLAAIARLKEKIHIQLTVVGEGPLEAEWKAYAHQLQLDQLITWYGPAKATEVATQIQAAHLLCLPSVRESGGAVLLEAMACARPVLAIDFGGPADVIDDTVGCVVSPIGTEAVIKAFMEKLQDIALYPDAWRKRGEMGRQKAEKLFGWENKIEQAITLYHTLIENK